MPVDHEDLESFADQLADAVSRRLAGDIAARVRQHQVKFQRTWLTPHDAARLVGITDARIYAALRSGELPAAHNAATNGGRGAWHIRRSDLDSWADRLRGGSSVR